MPSDDPIGLSMTEVYGRNDENDLVAHYDRQLMDEEELNLMRSEPVWQGFVTQSNELIMLGDGKEYGRPRLDEICIDEDQHGSVRSIGVGINSDVADIGSEVRESLVGGSSEGDIEYFCDHDVAFGPLRHTHHEIDNRSVNRSNMDKKKFGKQDSSKSVVGNDKAICAKTKSSTDGGFSFPPPLRDGELVQAGSSNSLWSNNSNAAGNDEDAHHIDTLVGGDDTLSSLRRKSTDSSPTKSSRDDNNINAIRSANSSPSMVSDYGYTVRGQTKIEDDEKASTAREEDPGASLDEEEAAAVQEQVRQIRAQEEEFETFNLKIVHRKNRQDGHFNIK